jgi:formylglycine-generating enzyme required for sulfatase activity
MKKILLTAVAFLTLNAVSATAQVTIGSTADPQAFSILELESAGSRGMRLPQMTTAQRDDLELTLTGNAAAPGLQIFNKSTKCVETWNGTKWIQVCPPEGPFLPHYISTCDDEQSCKDIIGFTATALSGDLDWTNNTGIEFNMKPVTGGVFYMGSNTTEPNYSASGNPNEGPVHKVALNSFYMSETEVTQKLFYEVMGLQSTIWSSSYGVGDAYPAYNVSWYDAIAFCNKLSLMVSPQRTPCYAVNGITDWENLAYSSIPTGTNTDWDAATCDWSADGFRLPNEAEWEYAARGGQANEYTRTLGESGTQYIYSGSNNICEVAWYYGNNNTNAVCEAANGIFGTKQVKGKKANELGIYDMSGNVWELCWDWRISTYGSCCVDNINARGPSSGSLRILRGGHWIYDATYCRVSFRFGSYPHARSIDCGLRVVAGAL